MHLLLRQESGGDAVKQTSWQFNGHSYIKTGWTDVPRVLRIVWNSGVQGTYNAHMRAEKTARLAVKNANRLRKRLAKQEKNK